jgi:hypothetical protein
MLFQITSKGFVRERKIRIYLIDREMIVSLPDNLFFVVNKEPRNQISVVIFVVFLTFYRNVPISFVFGKQDVSTRTD